MQSPGANTLISEKNVFVCVCVLIGFGGMRYASTEDEKRRADALVVIVQPAAGTSTVSEQR